MKHFLLLIYMAVFLQIHEAESQIPGYQGKRFIASYNVTSAPNLYSMIEFGHPLRLYLKHTLEADYVIGRHTSGGLELSLMRHNYPVSYTQASGSSNMGTFTSEAKLYNVKIQGFAIGTQFKFFGPFSKSSVAPLGSYLSLHTNYLSYTMQDKFGATKTSTLTDSTMGLIEEKANGVLLGLGFGTRRIYNDKITLVFAMSTNFAYLSSENNGNPALVLHRFVLNRHWLMYKVGIGGLLF